MSESLTPGFLFPAGFSQASGPVKLYLDESGTLGYAGEVFTMAVVLVRDLPRLETSVAKHKVTQTESKASQMRTAQKLALARTLIEENDIHVYLADLDPRAAMVSERKLDKDMLYDSMAGQALAYYLSRGEMERGRAYRLSMDIRGSLRESYEDMVRGSIGNVLMHRADPLVSDLDVRFLDSKFSAGVQAADLFSNLYRTALMQKDSPCQGFLRKYVDEGVISAGFTFGLPQLADQMTQIAADLRALVEYEGAVTISLGAALFAPEPSADKGGETDAAEAADEPAAEKQEAEAEAGASAGEGRSRSARRRRSRKAKREQVSEQPAAEAPAEAPAQIEAPTEAPEEPAGKPAPDEEAPAEPAAATPNESRATDEPKVAGEPESADAASVEKPQAADEPAQPTGEPAAPADEGRAEKPARRRRGGKRHASGRPKAGLSEAARALIEQAESERAALDEAGTLEVDGHVWHTAADWSQLTAEAEDAEKPEEEAPESEETGAEEELEAGEALEEPVEEPAGAPDEPQASRDMRPGRSLRARQTHAPARKGAKTAARQSADGDAREADAAEVTPSAETVQEKKPAKRTRTRSRKSKAAAEQAEQAQAETPAETPASPQSQAPAEAPAAAQPGAGEAPDDAAVAPAAEETPAAPAPKKRTRARKPRAKAAKPAADEAPMAAEAPVAAEVAETAADPTSIAPGNAPEVPTPEAGPAEPETGEQPAAAPKRRTRTRARKPKAAEEGSPAPVESEAADAPEAPARAEEPQA